MTSQPGTTHITSAPVVVSEHGSMRESDTGTEGYRPNRKLLFSGALTFGLSYAPAAVVGSTSDHQGDRNLLIPVIGPWVDLADRGPCNGSGQPRCSDDTAPRVLIAIDGVLQGLGVLQFASAFIWPEPVHREVIVEHEARHRHRTPPATPKLEWQVAPGHVGRTGYGLSVLGKF